MNYIIYNKNIIMIEIRIEIKIIIHLTNQVI